MIFTIKTNDEVAGFDITAALTKAGISHTILSKQNDNTCPICGSDESFFSNLLNCVICSDCNTPLVNK